ncbi:hypothetical protein LXL04_005389 [Taraxacum kok-saghyz]
MWSLNGANVGMINIYPSKCGEDDARTVGLGFMESQLQAGNQAYLHVQPGLETHLEESCESVLASSEEPTSYRGGVVMGAHKRPQHRDMDLHQGGAWSILKNREDRYAFPFNKKASAINNKGTRIPTIEVSHHQLGFIQCPITQFHFQHSKSPKEFPPNINASVSNNSLISISSHNVVYTITIKYRLHNLSIHIIFV